MPALLVKPFYCANDYARPRSICACALNALPRVYCQVVDKMANAVIDQRRRSWRFVPSCVFATCSCLLKVTTTYAPMLEVTCTYYAQNYAGIVRQCLPATPCPLCRTQVVARPTASLAACLYSLYQVPGDCAVTKTPVPTLTSSYMFV